MNDALPGGLRFDRKTAAQYLGLEHGTLAQWACRGYPNLPYYRCGRKVTYLQKDLDAFMGKNRVGGGE